jgi:hypothetical protein
MRVTPSEGSINRLNQLFEALHQRIRDRLYLRFHRAEASFLVLDSDLPFVPNAQRRQTMNRHRCGRRTAAAIIEGDAKSRAAAKR